MSTENELERDGFRKIFIEDHNCFGFAKDISIRVEGLSLFDFMDGAFSTEELDKLLVKQIETENFEAATVIRDIIQTRNTENKS